MVIFYVIMMIYISAEKSDVGIWVPILLRGPTVVFVGL